MTYGPSFRAAVADCAPAVRQLTDTELRAFGVAILAELARREGTGYAAQWTQDQATWLSSTDRWTA